MRRVVAAALACCCLLSVAAAPVGAVHEVDRTLVVDLRTNGDATVTFVRDYNLSHPADREEFRRYRDNATARQERLGAFVDRLERGAAIVRERTDRDPTVGEARAAFAEENGTGTMRLSAPIAGVAAVSPRAVVLTQPFSGGFEVNGTLTVYGPQGYVRESVRPPPDRARRNSASWDESRDLSGFAARFEKPPTPTPTPEGWGTFTGAALLALFPALAVAAAALRYDPDRE